MKVRPLSAAVLVSLALASPVLGAQPTSAPAAPAASAERVPFIEGRPFAEILKKAKAEKKPIFLDVYAVWCGPCKLLDRTTFVEKNVVDWARKTVISAKFDAEKGEGRKVAQRYAVHSFPTLLFLDEDGNELDRLQGAFMSPEFLQYAGRVLSRQSPIFQELERLKTTWNPQAAGQMVGALAGRGDLKRVRPLAVRLVSDDPDMARTETIDSFALLVYLEDLRQQVSAETADLIVTMMPRMGSDPRRAVFGLVLARELARRGDLDGVRQAVKDSIAAAGPKSPYASDLLAAQGGAERKAGKLDAAIATFRRALASAEEANGIPSRNGRRLDLADALAAAGKKDEARSLVATALQQAPGDAAALTRAARVSLALKESKEALGYAQKAVSLTVGEDAEAQVALAQCLAASGDATGAAAAWKRAGELEPENADVKKQAGGGGKRKAA